jgi:hypothetical protein
MPKAANLGRISGTAHGDGSLKSSRRRSGCDNLVRRLVPGMLAGRGGLRFAALLFAALFIVRVQLIIRGGAAILVPSPRTFRFALGPATLSPVLDVWRWETLAGELRPIKHHAGILCLERPPHRLVERLASHPYPGRRSKPVQETWLR